MKLTKQQKMMSSVMAIALSGLAVDRFVLGTQLTGPTPTYAITEHEDTTKLIQTHIAELEAELADTQNHVAISLTAMSDTGPTNLTSMRDIFQPSSQWIDSLPVHIAEAPGNRITADQFVKNHALGGLMTVDGMAYALIDNDHFLRLGDTLDGFMMVSLDKRTAIFTFQDTRIVLTLEADS